MDCAGRTQVIWTSTTQATAFDKDCSQAFITEVAASSLYLYRLLVESKPYSKDFCWFCSVLLQADAFSAP